MTSIKGKDRENGITELARKAGTTEKRTGTEKTQGKATDSTWPRVGRSHGHRYERANRMPSKGESTS